MSILVMSMVWAHGPEAPNQRLMMLAVADNANDRGVAWPSVATLAEKCSVGERAAQYTLATLQKDGWLAIEERPGKSNYYRVNLARLRDATDCTPEADCTPGVQPIAPPGVQPIAPEPSVEPSGEPSLSGDGQGLAFRRFWEAYPKKVDKKAAMKAWYAEVTKPGIDPEIVMSALEVYLSGVSETRYTKNPATWLRATDFAESVIAAGDRQADTVTRYMTDHGYTMVDGDWVRPEIEGSA